MSSSTETKAKGKKVKSVLPPVVPLKEEVVVVVSVEAEQKAEDPKVEDVVVKKVSKPRAKKEKKVVEESASQQVLWEHTTEFVFPVESGEVIKVYDGDTITIAAKLPYESSPLYRIHVRLNGIDTPEIKGKSPEEKELSKEARDSLSNLVLHKKVQLKNVSSEKYGRLLADVHLDEVHVNQWLVDQRYAVKYDGGAKKVPVSWKEYKHTGAME
jgi:endonuclease YncB( thermonuclease family)